MVLEKTLESPLDCKEIQPVHSEGEQPWDFFGRNDVKSWNSSTLTTTYKELTHWKRLWCRSRLKAGGEGDDRGWDDWMASWTQWTLVWVGSGSWWWTGKPGVLQSMGSQRVRHNWATELNWLNWYYNGRYMTASSVHGISQARVLKWVPLPFPGIFLGPRGWTYFSRIGRSVLYH